MQIRMQFASLSTKSRLANFWEIEDVSALPSAMFTPNELACISHSDTTTTYGQNGSPQILPIDQHEAIYDPDGQKWLPDIGE